MKYLYWRHADVTHEPLEVGFLRRGSGGGSGWVIAVACPTVPYCKVTCYLHKLANKRKGKRGKGKGRKKRKEGKEGGRGREGGKETWFKAYFDGTTRWVSPNLRHKIRL